MAALAAVTSPGDTVLIPDPGFPTYKLACDFLGLKTLSYSLYPKNSNVFPTINYLDSDIKNQPKVIIVNNPSNPLGIAYGGEQILSAIKSLIDNGVQMIIDETYINLVYDSTVAFIPNVDAIRIRTFSKEHCSPGLRVGYVLANQKYSGTIADFISLTISCAPKFIQMAIADYLSSNESSVFRESVTIEMKRRHGLLLRLLPDDAVLVKPNSAFYAMIETGNSEESFNFFLERNVATCPGSKFGSAANTALRISIAGNSDNLIRDFEILHNAYHEWRNK
jgi:aspartate/methionine/tyrosine aminotransferase